MSVALKESKSKRVVVVNDLKILLSNSYVLYVKTQNFHWNVIGPRFHQLHVLFQEHYTELAEAIDEIAEQIRILQGTPPSSMSEFLNLSTLDESSGKLSEDEMLSSLLEDNEKLVEQLIQWIEAAQKSGDESSADLFVGRLRDKEKNSWILRNYL